ncbi:MAG: hypothetical protein Q8920_03450 [Bacillota bacterium]|nr:hypothetical protein [Bacillota bacterium]
MKWLDRLERKFGRFAIKGLMYYIVILNAVVFLLMHIDNQKAYTILDKLMLDPSRVLHGEVWRIFSFVLIPPDTSSPFWIIFVLYFYYMIGTALEHEWGSFKFNVYYLIGILVTAAASFITGIGSTALYLNLSLFLAFAYIYPNYEILLFFILPVKVKYLAWIEVGYVVYAVITEPLYMKIAAIVSLLNFVIFFGKAIITHTSVKRSSYYNRSRFNANIPKNFTLHKCVICGVTEKENPKMEFRYCNDCEGDYEYCMDHLYTHQHVKK